MEDCEPCGFGFTSREGATSREECRPVQQACPIGQWAPADAVSKEDCRCYKGFGGELCDTFGGEDMLAHGPHLNEQLTYVMAVRAASAPHSCCVKGKGSTQRRVLCPIVACPCAGGDSPSDACTMCPRGTYSANKGTERCLHCPLGYTSPEGSSSVDDCHPIDVCPAGTGAFRNC